MFKSIIYQLIIGTYGTMVYMVDFNPKTESFKVVDSLEVTNSSYVISQDNNVYAFSESGEDSKVYSFRDGVSREVPCPGDNPCYMALSPHGNMLLTADYSGGSVSVYSLQNGAVAERIQKLAFEGSGPVARRQGSSHIHPVKILPKIAGVEGEWILAPDLGSDKIRVIRYSGNAAAPLEHLADIPFPAGSGPRHIEFDEQRQMMYCIAELSGKVFVFRMASKGGVPAFELVQSAVADEYNTGGSGDIHLHPGGKFLYTSHRLQNDGLAVFAVKEDGTIEKKGYVPTKEHPRNFLITPCGKYLIVASKNTCTLQLFKIGADGIPVATDSILEFSPNAPTCVVLR